MDDIPWIPLAMVVIAFLTWLKNRIEEASERRREMRARREAAQRARNSSQGAEPSYQSPYREEEEVYFEEEVPEVPKTFRELMAEIEASSREEVAEPKSSPPPLPGVPPPPSEPELFESEFPTSLPDVTAKPTPTLPAIAKTKPGQKNEATHRLARALKNRSQLRNALILKEILDKPKALQR